MELHIERRRVTQGDKSSQSVERIASVPFASGTYDTGNGEISLQVGKFNHRKNVQKVVLTGENFSTKKSTDRRVVRFPQRQALVVQEISKTEQLVFIRSGVNLETPKPESKVKVDASADYEFTTIFY